MHARAIFFFFFVCFFSVWLVELPLIPQSEKLLQYRIVKADALLANKQNLWFRRIHKWNKNFRMQNIYLALEPQIPRRQSISLFVCLFICSICIFIGKEIKSFVRACCSPFIGRSN